MRTGGKSAFYLSRLISRREGEETLCNVDRFLGTSLKANGFVFFRSARMRERERENFVRAAWFQSRALCATKREREREEAAALLVLDSRKRGREGGEGRRRETSEARSHLLSFPPEGKAFDEEAIYSKGANNSS